MFRRTNNRAMAWGVSPGRVVAVDQRSVTISSAGAIYRSGSRSGRSSTMNIDPSTMTTDGASKPGKPAAQAIKPIKRCRASPRGLLRVAMASRFLCCRFQSPNRWGLDAIAKGLRISHDSARRGFYSAELAVEREPGCKLAVSVLDLPEPEAGPKCRPLYGPIPWSW